MGFFKAIRRARAEKKAIIKAAKVRAREEVKRGAQLKLQQEKLLANHERKLLKHEHKTLQARRKHEEKMAKAAVEQLREGRFNAKKVLRYSAAIRALAPLALPLIYRAVVAFRESANQSRAQKLGVSVDELSAFSGHGAELKARIAQLRKSVDQFGLPAGYRKDVHNRLDELRAAVDNAEFMTTDQRKRAHRAIDSDLEELNKEVLSRSL
ncbi:MAG: DUF6474 family protein [Corynebacterium sp.]|uniref:DUF6474 family protein n=1 Tax=Corynebacterium sp. TaxID=1720 RepID=UPI0026DBC8EF|nr:DUF6474 family protein [Corynebacterium sp.]MDO4761922.1 DUF6474 family protein [Corynebacterium sp.]